MFNKIFNWMKENKIVTVVLVVLVFLLLKKFNNFGVSRKVSRISSYDSAEYSMEGISPLNPSASGSAKVVSLPSSVSQNRRVVTNSSFSLLVKKVNDTVDSVAREAESMGGFVVNTVINRDEEADSANIEVRVPSDKLEEFSKYLRSISVKVVYENVIGYDITDQYT
ncbi:MAG: DUF4349 domain-containing protein, partial [Patescibacteria group bacterium]